MSVPLLDLRAQHATIKDAVLAAMLPIVENQTFILGALVAELEADVAALSKTKYAIGCANGTDALLIAMRALDIGRGDEVVTTPFTFFATGGTIHNVGATPVFVDIDPKTYNLRADLAAAAVTSKTKAVIPVDLFGQIAPIEEFQRLMPRMPIIEDAAQSIGARRSVDGEWRMAGELATIGTFSFFPSKNLGGYGDGGMMVTQDENLYNRLMKLRTHGSVKTYFHEEVGYNSRLDTLQAAVLKAKLPYLAGWSAKRRENAAYYNAAFAGISEIVTPFVEAGSESIFNQYTIRVPQREKLREHLGAKGIGHSVYYPLPLHLQPCFEYLGYKAGSCPESEKAANEVLSLPVYPELTRAQLDEVVAAVKGFFGK